MVHAANPFIMTTYPSFVIIVHLSDICVAYVINACNNLYPLIYVSIMLMSLLVENVLRFFAVMGVLHGL